MQEQEEPETVEELARSTPPSAYYSGPAELAEPPGMLPHPKYIQGPCCSEGFPGPIGAVGFSDPPGPCIGIPDDPDSPGTPGEDGEAEPVDSIRCGGGASNDAVLAELNTAITDCLRRIAVLEQYLKPTKFVSLMGTVKAVETPLIPVQVIETNQATMAPMHEVLGRSGATGTLGLQCDLGEVANAYRN